jgi:hypothetical protein
MENEPQQTQPDVNDVEQPGTLTQRKPRERAPRPSNEITEMVDCLADIWERLEKSRFICVNGRSQNDVGEFVSTLNEAAKFQENRSLVDTINALSHGNQRNFNDYLFNNKIVFWCLLTNFNTISTNLKRHKMFYINFDRQEKVFSVKINEEISTDYNPLAPKNNTRQQSNANVHRRNMPEDKRNTQDDKSNAPEGRQTVRTGRPQNRPLNNGQNTRNKPVTGENNAPFKFDKSGPKFNKNVQSHKGRAFEENSKYADGLNINNFKQEEKKFATGVKPQTFDTQPVTSSAPLVKSTVTTAPTRPILQKSWADETDD